jgi:hypothetical protein
VTLIPAQRIRGQPPISQITQKGGNRRFGGLERHPLSNYAT